MKQNSFAEGFSWFLTSSSTILVRDMEKELMVVFDHFSNLRPINAQPEIQILKGSQNLNVLGVYLDRISNVLQLSKDKSLILRASNCIQGCVECYENFLWNYYLNFSTTRPYNFETFQVNTATLLAVNIYHDLSMIQFSNKHFELPMFFKQEGWFFEQGNSCMTSTRLNVVYVSWFLRWNLLNQIFFHTRTKSVIMQSVRFFLLTHLVWADFKIKVKQIAHSTMHFDQWNPLISEK